jgi:hypothetical protein
MMLLASTAMVLLASIHVRPVKVPPCRGFDCCEDVCPDVGMCLRYNSVATVDAATAGPRTGTLQDLMASHPENRFSCLGWLRFPSFWPF